MEGAMLQDNPGRALDRLLEAEGIALLSSMLEHIHEGVVITDPASRIRWANTAYCTLTGYPLEALLGETPALLRPADAGVERSREIWDAIGTTGRFTGRIQNQRADGTLFYAEIAIVRLPPPPEGPSSFLCTMRDVTVDVELERHLALEMSRAEQARDTTIFALASLAEQRDPDSGLHLRRIEEYTTAFAQWVVFQHRDRLPEFARDPETIGRCARLHDIGKVGVADAVLLKRGPLDPEEQVQMRRHPRLGAAILDRVLEHQPGSAFLRIARDIVAFHHEAFDGSGYPYGLVGDDIPLHAQITTVADVLDALTSRRPYKPAHRFEDAVEWIVERRGTLFGPLAVEALLARKEKAAAIQLALGDPSSEDAIRPSGIDPRLVVRASSRPPVSRRSALHAALDALASELGGEIVVRRGAAVGRVYVWRGRVAWAWVTSERRVLTEALVEDHGIALGDIQAVIADCKRTSRNFGETLLEWGLMERDRFREVLRSHVGLRLRTIVEMDGAHALFVPQSRPYGGELTFSVDELLEGGVR
jgi:PAS domain S-box-containing protein